MTLTQFIAHRIQHQPETGLHVTLADSESSLDEHIEHLADDLNNAYLARIGREHGSFASEDAPSVLLAGLQSLLKRETSFHALTAELTEQFKAGLREQAVELNAYALFFVEESSGTHRFSFFVAGQKSTRTITPELAVDTVSLLDVGPSMFGIRVDINEWQKHQNYSYLSMITARGNRLIAEQFKHLTGFANGLNSRERTQTFLEGVEAYSQQVPTDEVDQYRTQVVDYCLGCEEQDTPVELTGLSNSLDTVQGDDFSRFMADFSPDGEHELRMDRRSLRRYVKFAGREKDLAISFSSHQLNNRVQYDAEQDTLSISGIPKALRKQLLEHMDQQ